MKDENIHKGNWWIPGKSKNQVSGTLTTYIGENIILETIGVLGDISFIEAFSTNSVLQNIVIWGVDSDATPISVFGCATNMTQNTSCSFPIVRYDVQVVAIGAHINSWDDLGNYDIKVEIPELPLWFRPNCLQTHSQGNDFLLKTSLKDSNKTSVLIEDGCNLLLEGEFHYSLKDFGLNVNVVQNSILKFSFDHAISMQDAKDKVFQFEQFLSFATLSPIQCSHFWLVDKEKLKDPLKKCSIEIIDKRISRKVNTRFWEYLFVHETIAKSFGMVIKKWYEDKELFPIRAHLIDSISHKGYFEPNDFLIVCQAIEGFYCRFRKEDIGLFKILEKLIEEFSDIKCQEISETDISFITNTRHYFSHLLLPGKKSNVVNGHELYNLNHKLRKLLICCVLQMIGFSNDEINNIFAHSNNSYLRMISGESKDIAEEEPIKLDAEIISAAEINETEPE